MFRLNRDFLRSDTGRYQEYRLVRKKVLYPLLHCAFFAVLATLTMWGCGTPHATLDLVAPSSVAEGTSFSVTVNVIYQGKPDTAINSRIHFTSSDPKAVLPGDYYFTPSDAGSHTWTNGFVLTTPGSQSISATIVPDSPGINGTAKITVSP
ncbi:MAG: hypothetical protein WA477_11235 [Candidatus Sulfotelmatobacter sp.]